MAILTPVPGPPPATTTGGVNIMAHAGLQNIGEVVVEAVPPKLQLLARMILLSGTVILPEPPKEGEPPAPPKPDNVLTLRTQLGEITIRISAPLPLDKVLTLQIPPGAPPVRAQVFVTPSQITLGTTPQTPVPTVSTPVITSSPSITPAVGKPVVEPVPTASAPAARAPTPVPTMAAPFIPLNSLPLLPGTVLMAETLALPEPFMGTPIKLASTPLETSTQNVVAQIRRSILPVKVEALVEMLRHIPAAALLMPKETEEKQPSNKAVPASPEAPALKAPSVTPSFSTTPAVLALPAGARVTFQVERIILPEAAPPPPVKSNVAEASPMPTVATIRSVNAPSAPAPALSPTAPAPQPNILTRAPEAQAAPPLTALVVGTTPHNEPIVTSPAGLFVLTSQAPLPVNTKVEFSFISIEEVAENEPQPLAPRQFHVLHETLAALAVPDPAAHAAVTARMPQPASNLGSMALLFLSALRLGDLEGWLGDDATQRLRAAGGEGLITRLGGEFTAARPPEQAPTEGWKTFALPLPAQGRMAEFVIHSRREADPAEPAEFGKRLLVEVEFSRLGPMQLDGFLRRKNFDLTLRSQRTLPLGLREELRTTFRTALEAVGCKGGLKFETAAELWLKR